MIMHQVAENSVSVPDVICKEPSMHIATVLFKAKNELKPLGPYIGSSVKQFQSIQFHINKSVKAGNVNRVRPVQGGARVFFY